jgi:hypothetical protein
MNAVPMIAVIMLAGAASTASADEWQYWVGVHDFKVPDVDSHTYGVTGGVSVDKQTKSGTHLIGSVDLFLDRDKDDLDPDHIPIRWDVHLGSDGELWQAGKTHVGWTADVNTRMNTVSSIEREITALPAIVGWYDGAHVRAALKAGAGWFFLEIDDDVPKTRGYDRGDFRNNALGYSVAADLRLKLGACCQISAQAQQWWDSHEWLQNQYEAALHLHGEWMKRGELVLSADAYEYNLDVYQNPGEPAILPWNDDLLIRFSFKTAM